MTGADSRGWTGKDMSERAKAKPKVMLLGLDADLEADLGRVLSAQGCAVHFAPFLSASQCVSLIAGLDACLVFCAAEPACYPLLLEVLRQKRPGFPVVVVSRSPEAAEWLRALEAGASDYCAPPFEFTPIRWSLEKTLKTSQAA